MSARNEAPIGLVLAGSGATLVLLAVILMRIHRRNGAGDATTGAGIARPVPAVGKPVWTPGRAPTRNGEAPPRSATWALMESMRADATKDVPAQREAPRAEQPDTPAPQE